MFRLAIQDTLEKTTKERMQMRRAGGGPKCLIFKKRRASYASGFIQFYAIQASVFNTFEPFQRISEQNLFARGAWGKVEACVPRFPGLVRIEFEPVTSSPVYNIAEPSTLARQCQQRNPDNELN